MLYTFGAINFSHLPIFTSMLTRLDDMFPKESGKGDSEANDTMVKEHRRGPLYFGGQVSIKG